MKYPARCTQIARAEGWDDLDWMARTLRAGDAHLLHSAQWSEFCVKITACADPQENAAARADAAFVREEIARREQQPAPWCVNR